MKRDRFQRLKISKNSAKVFSYKGDGDLAEYSTEDLHVHSFHQILFIKNGVSVLIDNQMCQPLMGQAAAFIPAEVPHRSTLSGPSASFLSLFIEKSLFKTNLNGIRIFLMSDLARALLNRLNDVNFVDLTAGTEGKCYDVFKRILAEDLDKTLKTVRIPESKNPINQNIIRYLKAHYAEKVSINDLKAVIPYSVRHFTRLFNNELRVSIFEYLKLYRLLMSTTLLVDQTKSITDIAYDSGYKSISGYYKDFNKYFGIAPKELRKTLRSSLE